MFGDEFADGVLETRHVLGGRRSAIEDVALLTYATARVPDDALAAPLRAAGIDLRLVGDCFAPRSMLVATGEGHRVGLAL